MRILIYILPILNNPIKQSNAIRLRDNCIICDNCSIPLPEIFYNEIKNVLSYDFILIDKCINIYATISPENLAPEVLINLYYKVKNVINQTKNYSHSSSIVVNLVNNDQDFPDTFYNINWNNTEYKIILGLRNHNINEIYSKFKENVIPFHNKKIASPLNNYAVPQRIIDRNRKKCLICCNKSYIIVLSACCCEVYYCLECWCENVRNSNCIMCDKKINELNAISFVNDEYCLPVSLYTTKIKAVVSHEIDVKTENPSLTEWIKFFSGGNAAGGHAALRAGAAVAASPQIPPAQTLCVNLSDIFLEKI